jgi:hypothetical protein
MFAGRGLGADEWFLEKGPLSYFVAGCAAKK